MRVAFGAPHAESPRRGTPPNANFDAKSSNEGNHKFSQIREFRKKGLQQRLQRKATLDSKGTSGSRESVSTWHTNQAFFNALPDHA